MNKRVTFFERYSIVSLVNVREKFQSILTKVGLPYLMLFSPKNKTIKQSINNKKKEESRK